MRRRAQRAEGGELSPDTRLSPRLERTVLPYSYVDVARRLADPMARAVRPDFLTGRYVAGAKERAEASLGSTPARRRVLLHAGGDSGFCEVDEQALPVLDALASAGTVGALTARLGPEDAEAVTTFARRLARSGLLTAAATDAPLREPRPLETAR